MTDENSARDKFKRSSLNSAVLLRSETNGLTTTTLIYEKQPKRRISKRWRTLDKAIRKISSAQQTASSEFIARHERSNQKKKNGGLRDLVKNLSKAQRKGRKKLKLRFL